MRIAFFTHCTALYGANRSLINLIDGLGQYHVQCHVISPDEGDMTETCRDQNIPVFVAPIRLWVSSKQSSSDRSLRQQYSRLRQQGYAAKSLWKNLCILPTVAAQLRAWNVDIVYTNSSVTPAGALISKYLGIPHVWHLREFGDLDYNLHYSWGKGISRRVIASANAVIANSEAVRSYVLPNTRNKHIYVIYNGVAWKSDFDRLHSLAQAQVRDQGPYTFVLVGGIHPGKGQETAIRALSIVANHYPSVRLLIVGGGDTESLKRLADQLGIAGKVEFWGYIHNPYTAYLAADAALMCSPNEAMGRVTVEAMATCRPVIGYGGGGTLEIIEHGRTGLLYHEGSESLAKCMQQLVENPQWAHQLGEESWSVARDKYSIETYSQKVYHVLSSIPDRGSNVELQG